MSAQPKLATTSTDITKSQRAFVLLAAIAVAGGIERLLAARSGWVKKAGFAFEQPRQHAPLIVAQAVLAFLAGTGFLLAERASMQSRWIRIAIVAAAGYVAIWLYPDLMANGDLTSGHPDE